MRVKFDKLNRYETPCLTVCNPGSVYSNGVLTRSVGAIPNTSDEEIVFNFNATSTLNFRVTKMPLDETPESLYALKIYRSLQNRRLIFVEDIGYFVITDMSEDYESGLDYKDITASSCDIEIQNKALTYIEDGTYAFVELLEKIVTTIPKWTIGYIDPALSERYRTFEDVDTTLNTLAFLMDNMQEAYECIFSFDIITRTISAYDRDTYLVKTDIHLTKKDLIDSIQITENMDELYTALSVFGEEELTISSVNPIGTTTIYNFSHYLSWMSEALRNKVVSWTELVDSSKEPYYKLNLEYYKLFSGKSACQAEISKLETQKGIYEDCRNNVIAESSAEKLEEYNKDLAKNGCTEITMTDSIDELLAEIDRLIAETSDKIAEESAKLDGFNSTSDSLMNDIVQIQDSVSIQNYFSQEEYDELYDYIFEGTFTDDYVTVTESMDTEKRMEQMLELYSRAERTLAMSSSPVQEFTVETEDFVFVKEFQRWSEQLEVGCLINVELEEGDIAELLLNSMSINWEDKALSLTFGNRFNKLDQQSLFNDMLGNIQRSSNTIDYIKEIIYPVKNGKLSELEEVVSGSKTLTISDAISSQNGEVTISSAGYTARKSTTSGDFLPEQIKIASNRIVFTDDAWKTCETLLGYVGLSNGAQKYGTNAKSIIGELIVGGDLKITDSSGTDIFVVMDNKIDVMKSELTKIYDKKFEAVEEDLTAIDKSISGLNATVATHTVQIGDVPSGESLYSSVQDLKQSDESMLSDIDTLKLAVSEIQEKLGIQNA